VKNFINQGGDAAILRLFNVYGPEMDVRNNGYGRVIPNFINAIREDKELKIFGDGKQVRSFIWIDDIIEALELLIEVPKMPDVINIGNSEPITVYKLAEMICEIEQKKVNAKYIEKDLDDPLWRKPNIDRIKSLVDWEPKTSLKDGLTLILKGQKNE
ncbi:MAG: NAD-dependent epimerase/dehydratase family protein, partial [Acholeplasmataceae bacterium]|nr:NAD-dependent epimerase/dehydratase family protein [Acholeplasmataceae bacterium]